MAPSGFKTAVIDATQEYSKLFTTYSGLPETININIGYGEVGGASLPSGALAATSNNGYLVNYSTLTKALTGHGGYSFNAANEPSSSQFFVSSGEAKTLSFISSISPNSDASIGLGSLTGTGYSWNTSGTVNSSNTGTGTKQYDLQSAAQHEMSEVTGRRGLEHSIVLNNQKTFSTVDVFDYSSPAVLSLATTGG